MKILNLALITALLSTGLMCAQEPITIESEITDAIDGQGQAKRLTESTPGGASVLSIEESSSGNAYNTAEILTFTPGIYAKAGAVPLDARLSSRGGGATRRFGSRGVTLLIDGVPANIADGSYYSRGYDGSNISYVETYRGANGLARGSQSLGGSINFAQKNGITDPGNSIFVEAGSYDLIRTGITSDYREGKVDAFFNYSHGEADGYRDYQGWEQTFFNANVGYQWNETTASRFYLLHVNSDVELGSSLSFKDFKERPRFTQNNEGENRDLNITRLAQKTTFTVGSTSGEWHAFYQRTDFDHLIDPDTFRPGLTPNLIDYESDDFGLGLRTSTEYTHFTLRTDHAFTFGILDNKSIEGFAPVTGQEDTEDTFSNLKLYGELEYFISPKLSVFGGLGFVHATREREVGPLDVTLNQEFDESYSEFLPRFGLIYQLSDAIAIYGNYSRGFEAPATSEASSAAPQAAKAITSDTFEIGARSEASRAKGELSAFYSLVDNEFTNEGDERNADAVYSGLELGGSLDLLDKGFGNTGLFLDLNYIYSRYFFTSGVDQGQSLDGNTIPGLPKHSLNLRLKFQHEKGHEVALTLEAASGLFYDYLNTDTSQNPKSPGYGIVHLTTKYQVNDSLSLSAGIRNLFDRNYVSTVTIENGFSFPSGDYSGYSPGDGINFFAGAKLKF